MIRNALIIDTETTGLDHGTDTVIEIGCILYSVEHHTTLMQFSTLLRHDANAAEAVNRIPVAALNDAPNGPVTDDLLAFVIRNADVFVAHNAEFDQAFLPHWREHLWVCTKFDFRWPQQTREGESLVTLALNHGIGVASAHRALTDCQLIAALFDRMSDLPAMFAHAMRPKATFRALVSYDDREKAKTAGFQWNGATKEWSRRMAIDDAAALPFKTIEVART